MRRHVPLKWLWIRRGAVNCLGVLCLATASVGAAALPENTVVHVSTSSGWLNPRTKTCAGAVVLVEQRRYLVTAAHCLLELVADAKVTLHEGTVIDETGLRAATAALEVRVGDGYLAPEFDVFLLPLKSTQLTRTLTLPTRAAELAPDEELRIIGFPAGRGPVTAECRGTSGTLMMVDGAGFRASHGFTCRSAEKSLSGMSGGPVLDLDGRYVGMTDYAGVLNLPPLHKMGLIPFRVIKPTFASGVLAVDAWSTGYTFTDYVGDASGRTTIHVTYLEGRVATITVRAPERSAEFKVDEDPRRTVVTITEAGGRVRTLVNQSLDLPAMPSLHRALERLTAPVLRTSLRHEGP